MDRSYSRQGGSKMKPIHFLIGLFFILFGTALFMSNLGYNPWHLARLLSVIFPAVILERSREMMKKVDKMKYNGESGVVRGFDII